jgi:hypothetical protein
MGGQRYPASSGGRLDTCGPTWACSVKNVRSLSLAQVEALAVEAAAEAARLDPPRLGALVVKRSAGAGTRTPHLVVLTEDAWLAMQEPGPQVCGDRESA